MQSHGHPQRPVLPSVADVGQGLAELTRADSGRPQGRFRCWGIRHEDFQDEVYRGAGEFLIESELRGEEYPMWRRVANSTYRWPVIGGRQFVRLAGR